jgi:hypothetical protein
MTLTFINSKRILIPDAPLPSARKSQQGLVIAGIGIFCTVVEIAAVLLVFLGA